MSSLAQKLSDLVGAAFAAEGLPAELGEVRVSDRPDLAQFQCNGAMAAAKIVKKNPREIAGGVVERLKNAKPLHTSPPRGGEDSGGGESIFAKLEIAGPGFINIDVTDGFIAAHLSETAADERLGIEKAAQGETVILDYGGPNIAKPMHVGHLRSAIIGDSLRRIIDRAGYRALGDVHLGDWGTPMGMLLAYYEETKSETGSIEDTYKNSFQSHKMISHEVMQYLEDAYPKAVQLCKKRPEMMEKAREATRKLQTSKPGNGYYDLWSQWRQVSINAMKKNFHALGVEFDLWEGESSVHDLIAPTVETLKDKGLAEESEGALIVPVEEPEDKKEMPPLILYKSDGAVMYGTTDLATIVDRVEKYDPAKMIYVVDQRQALHFEQVFRAARKAGLVPEDTELTHAGFGTMNGPDGKPFKTREGGVMRLEDLIAQATDKATARLAEAEIGKEYSDEERGNIAHKVAIAALKFADLQNQRQADYIFDLDRMTMFEGKTGPYLLYQAVRIQSLLKKAESQNLRVSELHNFTLKDEDRPLALLLSGLSDHFAAALNNYTPHVLCDYAYKLAQEFSRFYGACHILSEKDETLRASRLALCNLTLRQLTLVLGLLGIEIPERM